MAHSLTTAVTERTDAAGKKRREPATRIASGTQGSLANAWFFVSVAVTLAAGFNALADLAGGWATLFVNVTLTVSGLIVALSTGLAWWHRPSTRAPQPGPREANLVPVERTDDIDQLYRTLAGLRSGDTTGPETRREVIARLRELQSAEALELREAFERSLSLPLLASKDILQQARALRAEYANPARGDASRQRRAGT